MPSYPNLIARSAVISLFLATSAPAQTSFGQPQQQLYISIVNVAAGNGVYKPAVWIEDASGKRTQVLMGEDGLTQAILYDKEDLIAWVLARYGQVTNPKVFYDDRTGDKDTPNPPPAEDPPTDCANKTSAAVKTIDDLPIHLAGSDGCNEWTCATAFQGPQGQPMILRAADCIKEIPIDILEG